MMRSRTGVVVLVLTVLAAFTTGACSKGDPAVPTKTPSATTAGPTAEQLATTAHERYWDVYVQLANSGDIDPAAFDGVAEGAFVETDLKLLGNQADAGIVRVGEPELGPFDTTVEGDSATSLVCLDERPWGARSGDRDLEAPGDEFPPVALRATLTKQDSGWIVTDMTDEEDTACPAA